MHPHTAHDLARLSVAERVGEAQRVRGVRQARRAARAERTRGWAWFRRRPATPTPVTLRRSDEVALAEKTQEPEKAA